MAPKMSAAVFPLLLLSLLTTCDALRFPTARTVSQRVVSSLTPVPPSPFALSECFSPAAFSPPRTAQAQVTCVWEGVETQAVEALLKLALSSAFAELSVVSYRRASNTKLKLVVSGAKRTLSDFLAYAAVRDLEVAAAIWS